MKYLDALRKLDRGVPKGQPPVTDKTDKTLSTAKSELPKLTQPGFVSSASTIPDAGGTHLSVDEDKPLTAEQEAARQQVLALLAAHATIKRAFCNRFQDGSLIITLAIRGVGTGELLIPAERFNQRTLGDLAALLDCMKDTENA
jgi:hypothetical protein